MAAFLDIGMTTMASVASRNCALLLYVLGFHQDFRRIGQYSFDLGFYACSMHERRDVCGHEPGDIVLNPDRPFLLFQ